MELVDVVEKEKKSTIFRTCSDVQFYYEKFKQKKMNKWKRFFLSFEVKSEQEQIFICPKKCASINVTFDFHIYLNQLVFVFDAPNTVHNSNDVLPFQITF